MTPGKFNVPRQKAVVWNTPAADAIMAHMQAEGLSRAVLLSTRSLQDTALLDGIRRTLGGRLAGEYTQVGAHSPRPAVLAGAAAARDCGADVILAVGGGSVVDAAKIVQACLWADVRDEGGMAALADGTWPTDFDRRAGPRIVAVPTTLSAAEFTPLAGITDPARGVKDLYLHPLLVPEIVVLDPAATLYTPEWLLTSTGIRAMDHATATLCSTGATPYGDAMARAALPMLAQGLRGLRRAPDDMEARSRCLIGAWFAISGPVSGVPVGASHGIGRVIGAAFGVAHGHTSCVLMPGVLRWNREADDERQAEVAALIGAPGQEASAAVAALVAELGLPGRLSEVGIDRAAFPTIVKHAMVMLSHPTTAGNQRRVGDERDVEEMLTLCL